MDQSVTNELLNRIKALEDQNESIKKEIKKKKEEIASSNTLNHSSSLSLNHIENEIDKAIKKNVIIYHDLRSNEDNIKMNVIEYTIEYDPNDNLGQLYICGDFTNWELKLMNTNKGVYFYSTILLRNFKYYYCITDNEGQTTIDMNILHEHNPKTNQICNYIDLGSKGSPGMTFDYNLQGNILSLQRKNLLMIKTGNWDDVAYLESLLIYSNHYQQQFDIISKEREMNENAIDNYIEKKEFESFSFGKTKLYQLLSVFKGLIIIKDKKEFEIIEIEESENAFICLQLYDANHIQLNREYYIQNEIFSPIKFNEAITPPNKVLSIKETKVFMNQYRDNINEMLKVYYSKDQLQSASAEEYTPSKIEPSSIDINDYKFEIANNQIIEVKNRKDNLLIKFIATELTKPVKSKQIELYYSLNYKNINIVHIHYLDKSLLNIPIEGIVIDSKFDIKAFKQQTNKNTNSNSNSNSNRIYLLCKAMKPFKIYYQRKKVHFTSQSFVHERLYQIRSISIDSSFNQYYVKIKHIPIGYLIKTNPNDKIQGSQSAMNDYSPIEQCSKSNSQRGFIDANLLFDESKTILTDDLGFAFPPCTLIALDPKDEIELDKQYIEHKKKNSSYEMKKYELIKKELKNYIKYNEKEVLLTELPKESIKKMLFTLKDYESSAQMIAGYIEQKELWEKLDEIANMQIEIAEYIKLLSKYQ